MCVQKIAMIYLRLVVYWLSLERHLGEIEN